MQHRHYLFAAMLLLLLQACTKYRRICDDPAATNYADPQFRLSETIIDNRICIYGPSARLAGSWTYTDTFTYYPPGGGNPQTTYTTHATNIQFGNSGGSHVFISGITGYSELSGYVYTDSIVCTGKTLMLHTVDDSIQYITFSDGLTNSAVGYMYKQH